MNLAPVLPSLTADGSHAPTRLAHGGCRDGCVLGEKKLVGPPKNSVSLGRVRPWRLAPGTELESMIIERAHNLAAVADADGLGGSCAGHIDRGEGTAPLREPVNGAAANAVCAHYLPVVTDAVGVTMVAPGITMVVKVPRRSMNP